MFLKCLQLTYTAILFAIFMRETNLTLLHSGRSKLYTILAFFESNRVNRQVFASVINEYASLQHVNVLEIRLKKIISFSGPSALTKKAVHLHFIQWPKERCLRRLSVTAIHTRFYQF